MSYDINVSKITLRVYGIESAVKYLYIRFFGELILISILILNVLPITLRLHIVKLLLNIFMRGAFYSDNYVNNDLLIT